MKFKTKSLDLFLENNVSSIEKVTGGYLPPRMWGYTMDPVPGVTHDMIDFQTWTKQMTEANGTWAFGTAVPSDYTGNLYMIID